MKLTSPVAAALLGLAPELGSALVTRESSNRCCRALSSSDVGDKVVYPGDAAYHDSVTSYWAVNVQLEPTCIVQPTSADDVSSVVQTLTSAGGAKAPCQFAVRSGGHMTWAGANNIEPGVTIDLSMMNSTVYQEDAKVASILPGSRWQAVYEYLEGHGVTVPGGRTGPVGVGGFLLGGGNSFHGARVGLACDNVVNYEVVLSSGRIVNANADENVDLFKALKGGSSNFGIVTKYDVKTIDSPDMWGGLVVFDNSTTDQQIPALVKFIDNIEEDPYASWIGLWQYRSVTEQTTITTPLDYTKPEAFPAAFDDFYAIPNISDSTRYATVFNLTSELQQAEGYRDVFLTSSYYNSEDVLHKMIEILNSKIEEARPLATGEDWSIMVIVQPWPKILWQRNADNGIGNVLGLDRFDENMLQVLYDYSWDSENDDALFHRLCEEALAELDEYAKSIDMYNEYIYLNYADKTQNPLRGYGDENVQFIREVAERYDPEGVFQTQVPGGFKVSKA
ncbi:hypothetical protein BJX65DRAFT_316437 [Aspergillus insuetus]